MDPFHNQRYQKPADMRRNTAANLRNRTIETGRTDGTSDLSGNDHIPDDYNRNPPTGGNPQGTDRQPR